MLRLLPLRSAPLAKQLASQDRPQMLNPSYSYDLPFGRGKRFLKNSNAIVKQILGG